LPSESQLRRFEDILENVGLIERFAAGLSKETLAGNEQAFFAILHALLIISEAAKRLAGWALRPKRRRPINPGRPFGALAMCCAMLTTTLTRV
jgi:hypothetical protein